MNAAFVFESVMIKRKMFTIWHLNFSKPGKFGHLFLFIIIDSFVFFQTFFVFFD